MVNNVMNTIDEVIMYSFVNNHLPLLRLAQDDKIKKIFNHGEGLVAIELHKDTFKDRCFDNFLNEMLNTGLDYQIKVIGKRIFIMLHKLEA